MAQGLKQRLELQTPVPKLRAHCGSCPCFSDFVFFMSLKEVTAKSYKQFHLLPVSNLFHRKLPERGKKKF